MNPPRHWLNVLNLPSGVANHLPTLLRLPTNPILHPLVVIRQRIGDMLQPTRLIPQRTAVVFNRTTDARQPTHHVIYRIKSVFNPICHVSRGNPNFAAKEHKELKAIRLLRKAHLTVAASRQSAAIINETSLPIPTGLRHPAQGCDEEATLGTSAKMFSTLKGLHPAFTGARNCLRRLQPRWGWEFFSPLTQGSSSLVRLGATLGWRLESRWDSEKEFTPAPLNLVPSLFKSFRAPSPGGGTPARYGRRDVCRYHGSAAKFPSPQPSTLN